MPDVMCHYCGKPFIETRWGTCVNCGGDLRPARAKSQERTKHSIQYAAKWVNIDRFTAKNGGVKEIDEVLLAAWVQRQESAYSIVLSLKAMYGLVEVLVGGPIGTFISRHRDNEDKYLCKGYVNKYAASLKQADYIIPVFCDADVDFYCRVELSESFNA